MREDSLVTKDIIKTLNKIRPYIQSEGGDLEFVSFEDGVVKIKMLGACVGCGALDYTVKDGIEALLVEMVPEVIEVVNLTEEVDVNGLY